MPADQSVLNRKLRHGAVARSPLADPAGAGEALARGVEDRLRPILRCDVEASISAAMVARLSDATQPVTAASMIGVISVAGAATPGLISATPELVDHLVDLTLGGDPAAAPAPTDRALTEIDMTLCRLHLAAAIEALGDALAAGLGLPVAGALTLREQRRSLAQLRVAPETADVMVFGLALRLGAAGRKGQFLIILPLAAVDALRAARAGAPPLSREERPADLWRAHMRRAAAAARVPVDAVLHSQRMSLAAIRALEVGQVIEIPSRATEEVRLALAQPGGRAAILATARLGAYRDAKVVKLATAPDGRVAAHVARALGEVPPAPGIAEPPPAEAEDEDLAGPEPALADAAQSES